MNKQELRQFLLEVVGINENDYIYGKNIIDIIMELPEENISDLRHMCDELDYMLAQDAAASDYYSTVFEDGEFESAVAVIKAEAYCVANGHTTREMLLTLNMHE